MSKIFAESLPPGINPSKVWSQGDIFGKRRFFVSIIRGNSPFAYAQEEDSWFWSPRWQQMEAEADQDLAEGNYTDFNNADDLFNDLNRKK
jgi:hypothetical protein